MGYKIRIHTLGQQQYLLANFRRMDWAFYSWVDINGKVTMNLRTNVPTHGSNPAQDMITVTTSTSVLKPHKWADLSFVWNPSKRSFAIYVDGKVRGSGIVRSQVHDMTLKKSSGELTWGIKEDSSKHGTLSADIKDFYFYRSAVYQGCGPFQCSAPLLEAYYSFGGSWYDMSHHHRGQASPRNGNNVKMGSSYVTIEKQSYVAMPNIDISTGPWTMGYKIRIHTLGQQQYLLANFRRMDWAFYSWVDINGKVTMNLRTNVPTHGSNPAQDMITLTTSTSVLKPHKWADLRFVWNPSKRSFTIYVDGRNRASGIVRSQVHDMTLKKSNGELTWGIKEDSSKRGTLSADIRDFYFYRSAVNQAMKIKCNAIADVGFILDSSGSLAGSYNFEKDFLKSLAAAFGISKNGPRASVITFSLIAELTIKFNEYFDIASFNDAVDAIPLMGRSTRIDRALRTAQNHMFQARNGARGNTPKILILLTDGSQTQGGENPADISKTLRQTGIHVIVVGIGSGINKAELVEIAGSSDRVFSAASFDELISKEFTSSLMEKSCKEVAL